MILSCYLQHLVCQNQTLPKLLSLHELYLTAANTYILHTATYYSHLTMPIEVPSSTHPDWSEFPRVARVALWAKGTF